MDLSNILEGTNNAGHLLAGTQDGVFSPLSNAEQSSSQSPAAQELQLPLTEVTPTTTDIDLCIQGHAIFTPSENTAPQAAQENLMFFTP